MNLIFENKISYDVIIEDLKKKTNKYILDENGEPLLKSSN
jgi:hypothetical protein